MSGHLVAYVATLLPLQTSSSGAGGCQIAPSGASVRGLCTATGSLHIPVAYASILPVLVVSIGALVLLVVSAVLPKRSWPGLYAGMTLLIGGFSAGACIWEWLDIDAHGASATIGQQVLYDHFSVFLMLLISVAIVLGALLSDSYLQREGLDGVEAYVLMLFSGAGAMLMAESGGLIMVFLGLEVMSISMYVMAAFHRRRTQSGEAGLKYFILGSFSSAIFLYGVALVYGATGTTQFGEIATFLAGNVLVSNGVLLAGMGLIIVGLGFKVSAVPFHFWTPDVYQGAPAPFTGYMAAVAKAAGFAALFRVLVEALPTQSSNWRPVIWLVAVLTLAVGSVLAIAQRDLKRMLAYSSISQAGYVLIALQAGTSEGTAAALFYLLTYVFIIMGSFAVVALVQGEGEARNDLGAIRGLHKRQPALAAAMLVFLLAQAGVPFTSGFLAKFYVLEAAVEEGQFPLALIGMVAAAVAAFFYLRVVILMYSEPTGPVADDGTYSAGLQPVPALDEEPDALPVVSGGAVADPPPSPKAAVIEPPPTGRVPVPASVTIALAVCVAFTIFAGVSSPVIDFAQRATLLF